MPDPTDRLAGIDWAEHWAQLVAEHAAAASSPSDPAEWDRRATNFARTMRTRADGFLEIVAPYLSPRKTLIDVGAGVGTHSVPLAERLEWVTAIEPSEGMRSLIPHRDNMTVIASTWEDAEVAPADLVICCHVMYGVADPIPFIAKLERSARERIFIMMREGPEAHTAMVIRELMGTPPAPALPRLSDLFQLLLQIGIAADVSFIRYPVVHRYAGIDEALADCRGLVGDGWDEAKAEAVLREVLTQEGDELVFDAGVTLAGVAHWQPRIN